MDRALPLQERNEQIQVNLYTCIKSPFGATLGRHASDCSIQEYDEGLSLRSILVTS